MSAETFGSTTEDIYGEPLKPEDLSMVVHTDAVSIDPAFYDCLHCGIFGTVMYDNVRKKSVRICTRHLATLFYRALQRHKGERGVNA